MVKAGTHRGSVKDDGGAEASRRATARRRQPPHGMGKRRRQSSSLMPRRGRHQSPSVVALFLIKKGKLVRRETPGLPCARRVPNATRSRCNRLGSVVLTLGELRRITKNFSDDQLVGEGAFGKVYKGVLTNGDIIAVKRFASTITGLQDVHYENEAQHLMSLKHPNIVQLVGYCSETEMKLVKYNGKFVRAEQLERLLCLEYMPKGSLRGHLSDETSGLEWNTRYKIIKAICYGLHYLHEEWQATPIIHMDLKPANILLDDNMVPKIADFGISRLFAEEQTRTCTRNCKGTPGYMPPKYIEKGVITKKYDIFSLGVLIIEIITGVKNYPTDEGETTFQPYIDLVLKNWRPRLRKAQGYTTSQEIDYQQIKKCIQIGLLCVQFDPAERPTINQIIKLLQRSDEAKVEEELQARLMKSPRYIERLPETPPAAERAAWKLAFRNPPQLPIFTGRKIADKAGNRLEVILVDADTGSPALLPQALRVELVPVMGDFPPDGRDDWSADEFQRNVVEEREGRRPLLMGDVSLTMRDGRATVDELQFTDNSSWVRCRKFRIAARAVSCDGYGRIQEAMTEALVVRNQRAEVHRKHYPPVLADDVWRLEKIGKEGVFHRKLRLNNVGNVQEFVRMLMAKPDELRAILGDGMTDKMWEVTTNHAKTCLPGAEVYAHSTEHGTIYLNSIFKILRVKSIGIKRPLQQLKRGQTVMVQQMLLDAYEHRHSLQTTDAFLLHGHAANNNVPLLESSTYYPAHVALRVPVPKRRRDELPRRRRVWSPFPPPDRMMKSRRGKRAETIDE